MPISGNGRHRRPRPTPAAVVTVATAAAAGAGIALPLIGATAAQAADNGTWDRVAACETGGLWSANTGNGFFGGLALTQTTWDEYGGDAYAARPDLASRAQQITIAEKVLATLGPDAWPGCQRQTGLLTDTATPSVDPGTPSAVPTLPGLPLPSLPGILPTGPGTAPSSPVPSAPDSGLPSVSGSPSATAQPSDGDGNGNSQGAPGSTASGTPTAPAGSTAPTTPPATGAPGATLPGAPTTTPGGRHGKPYDPTDEQLAAADRSTRTEVYGTTDADPSGTTTPGNANKGGKTGTSPTKDQQHYTVDPGDSLSGIAASHHVHGGWPALYDDNHQLIGGNPNLIKPGQILNLG